MGRTVTIPLSAGTSKPYAIDRDCLLLAGMAFLSGANCCVVSTDPALTGASLLTAPPSDASISGEILIAMIPASAGLSQNLQIPLPQGRTIYVNSSQNTYCLLVFADLDLAEFPVT